MVQPTDVFSSVFFIFDKIPVIDASFDDDTGYSTAKKLACLVFPAGLNLIYVSVYLFVNSIMKNRHRTMIYNYGLTKHNTFVHYLSFLHHL